MTVAAVLEVYEQELRLAAVRPRGMRPRGMSAVRVVSADGETLPLALERYVGPPTREEETLLARARGPVLDVGCGPGRHVLSLARRGVVAVGVDISPLAARLARRRGATVIEGSIFGSLPAAGRWASALLLDGNVGIGGDPAALLSRLAALLHREGIVLVETGAGPREVERLRVRIEAPGRVSEWFSWARVSALALPAVAERAGFAVAEDWTEAGRCFAELRRARAPRGRPGRR